MFWIKISLPLSERRTKMATLYGFVGLRNRRVEETDQYRQLFKDELIENLRPLLCDGDLPIQ